MRKEEQVDQNICLDFCDKAEVPWEEKVIFAKNKKIQVGGELISAGGFNEW